MKLNRLILLFLAAALFVPVLDAQGEEPPPVPADTMLPASSMLPADSKLVDVGGFRLHARVLGAQHPPPTVVFEAGFAQEFETWRGLPAEISTRSPVVLFERAGIGQSEMGPEPRTARRAAEELRRLLDQLADEAGISGPFVLVGHSLGGLYARVFADLYPSQVAGFVFVDVTTEGMHRSLWTDDGWAQYEAQLRSLSAGEGAEAAQLRHQLEELEALAATPDRPAVILTGRPEIVIPPETREQMEALGIDEEKLRELQDLKVRLHAELASKFPRGRHVEVEGAGHFVHWDAPDRVAEAIREVVREAASDPGAP